MSVVLSIKLRERRDIFETQQKANNARMVAF